MGHSLVKQRWLRPTPNADPVIDILPFSISITELSSTLGAQINQGTAHSEPPGFLAKRCIVRLGANRVHEKLVEACVELDTNSLAGSAKRNVDAVDGARQMALQSHFSESVPSHKFG